jgi:hypothetical protein
MTQSEFKTWIESIVGNMPMEEFVSAEVLEHMNRVHLENEARAWGYAREGAEEAYQVTIRAMVKTMFAIGYDAGREQAQVDSLFGGGDSGGTSPGAKPDDERGAIV